MPANLKLSIEVHPGTWVFNLSACLVFELVVFVENNFFWVFFLLSWVFELNGVRATVKKRVSGTKLKLLAHFGPAPVSKRQLLKLLALLN